MFKDELYPLVKELWELCEDIPDAPSIRSFQWHREVRTVIAKISKIANE